MNRIESSFPYELEQTFTSSHSGVAATAIQMKATKYQREQRAKYSQMVRKQKGRLIDREIDRLHPTSC
jgi:hypothetical protein